MTTLSPASTPYRITESDYYRLREMLFREFPEALEELTRRCAETGAGEVDKDSLWKQAGDKPLFSNMNVKAGRRSEKAWREGLFPDWRDMGSPDVWNIVYQKSRNARKTDNFLIEGAGALTFTAKRGKYTTLKDGTKFRRPRTALFRLYSMQSFARWLVQQSDDSLSKGLLSTLGETLGPAASIETVVETCRALASEFGFGWGVTTVLHALMDCGFWLVKPDVHLVKTVAQLGCLKDASLALADADRYLKKEACLFDVVDVARELAGRITPLEESRGKAIREVDVVLMRANYHGLVERFKHTLERKAA